MWWEQPWPCGHNDPVYRGPAAQSCAVCGAFRAEPLTADSVTDDQIRDLHEALQEEGGLTDDLHEACRVALYAALGSLRRVEARGRCAEILNARARGS